VNVAALPQRGSRLVLLAFGAAVLLHVDRTPLWASAMAVIALGWQWLHQRGRLALPGTLPRAVITFALLMGTVASFRSISGLAAGSTLLLVMSGAKLLETRQPRDARVMALASLGLLLAACLDRQSLQRVPLYLATGWLCLAALAAMGGDAESQSPRRALLTSGRALLMALPFALLCFLFVPRLPGALWSLPSNPNAQTGLGDEMTPGGISELTTSEEVAFRVRFDGAAPAPAQRYWRGPVLHEFDGYTWRRGRTAVAQPAEPVSEPLRYRVLLEPTGHNYLFGLDTIGTINGPRNILRFDGQSIAARTITSAISYEGVSYLQVRPLKPMSHTGRRLDTQLVEQRNPRARALAQQLRAQSASEREYVQRVLRYFHDAGFRYSHTPPLLDQDSVDDLIFRTRLGFCGHFASAYANLMRAVGIPARVVTGYLGGTWNPVGGYYVIRQSDAHAWTEVWLEDEGWVRVDPTAVVEPERLERSVNELLGDGALAGRLFVRSPWLRGLRNTWDATAAWWQERVVDYNMAAQLGLMDRLGLGRVDYARLALILLAGALLWGVWVYTRTPRAATPRTDALGGLWLAFIALLRRRGLTVSQHEGPQAIARRAATHLPALSQPIRSFADNYMRWRFSAAAGVPPANVLRSMRRELRQMARASRAARRSPAR
jgi:transglutaminase-like putative cysteine protease